MLADSVGLALLVVLETLTPAERLAFVLHDLFAVPFDEIARSWTARPTPPSSSPAAPAGGSAGETRRTPIPGRQREVVDAFLAAARGGDFDALLAVLDPDVDAARRPGRGGLRWCVAPRRWPGAP